MEVPRVRDDGGREGDGERVVEPIPLTARPGAWRGGRLVPLPRAARRSEAARRGEAAASAYQQVASGRLPEPPTTLAQLPAVPEPPPVPYVAPAAPAVERSGGLWRAAKGLVLAALVIGAVTFALLAVIALATVWNFYTATNRATASIGDRASEAVARTGAALGSAAQGLADARDPSHPPREPLAQDAEFAALTVVTSGGELPAARDYRLTLTDVRRRPDAAAPEQAQYAAIHRELRTPRETTLFGQTIRTDRDEADYYVYKGQVLRLGRDLYKVNWVSLTNGQLGLARLRQPESYVGALAFEVE